MGTLEHDVNLLDLDRWVADGAPHHWFTRLRAEAPVWRHPSPAGPEGDGPGFWVVSRHDDVTALGRCPHVLSSDEANGGVTGLGPGDELQSAFDAATMGVEDAKMLLTIDPPEHTGYRKLVNKGFTPRMVQRLEDTTRATVRAALDRDLSEPWDFVTDLAMPVPLRVIADLLGAPERDHQQILEWSNRAAASTDPEYSRGQGDMLQAALEFAGYLLTMHAERVADPGDDMVSLLANAVVDGEQLSNVRFVMFGLLLAAAGNETTRNAMSHAVLALAERPEQLQRLVDDPSLIPLAVEEALRWASSVLYFRRNAVDDMELRGQHIRKGDIVSLWYVSANRDDEVFDRPQEFDVGRSPNPHVAFGGGGPHFCLGASLARLEIRVVLEELVERAANGIRVVGPVSRLRSNFLHGIKHLPVAF